MAMTCSQRLESLGVDNEYFDTITVTDIPRGYFIAMTANSIAEGASTREVKIELMAAEWAEGGTHELGTGMYVRQASETAVKVSVYRNDTLECDCTQDYS